jgi:hypothetical protein
MNSVSLART